MLPPKLSTLDESKWAIFYDKNLLLGIKPKSEPAGHLPSFNWDILAARLGFILQNFKSMLKSTQQDVPAKLTNLVEHLQRFESA